MRSCPLTFVQEEEKAGAVSEDEPEPDAKKMAALAKRGLNVTVRLRSPACELNALTDLADQGGGHLRCKIQGQACRKCQAQGACQAQGWGSEAALSDCVGS